MFIDLRSQVESTDRSRINKENFSDGCDKEFGSAQIGSVEPDQVAGHQHLVLFCSSIESRIVVGAHKAHLGPNQNRAAHPVSPTKQVLGIGGFITGALSLDVVE